MVACCKKYCPFVFEFDYGFCKGDSAVRAALPRDTPLMMGRQVGLEFRILAARVSSDDPGRPAPVWCLLARLLLVGDHWITHRRSPIEGGRNAPARSCTHGLPHYFPRVKEHRVMNYTRGKQVILHWVLPMLGSSLFLFPVYFFFLPASGFIVFILFFLLFSLSTYFGNYVVFICSFSSFPLIFNMCIWLHKI